MCGQWAHVGHCGAAILSIWDSEYSIIYVTYKFIDNLWLISRDNAARFCDTSHFYTMHFNTIENVMLVYNTEQSKDYIYRTN